MMISQGEVERQYKKLMQEVATSDYYKIDLSNRVNCYVCDCGHITKTRDVDAGVTPFFFTCEKCRAMAKSTFYKDIVPQQEPTFEWYRPGLKELFKIRKNPHLLEHVLKGGLNDRKVQRKDKY